MLYICTYVLATFFIANFVLIFSPSSLILSLAGPQLFYEIISVCDQLAEWALDIRSQDGLLGR